MHIAILHDQYIPTDVKGVSGEDNLVNLEIELLKDRGHLITDLRGIETGIKRKILQGTVHVFGYGKGLPPFNRIPEVIHVHNLNQQTGYAWLKDCSAPVVQSLHNLRTFCSISIGWRENKHCYECLMRPTSVLKYRCGGVYGVSGGLRNIVFQRNRPQLHFSRRLIASSEIMKNLFSEVYPEHRIDVVHNPGIRQFPDKDEQIPRGWLFAGRLVREKGILDLIEYWPSDEVLDIAGSGPLFLEIRKMIQNRPNIKLIGVFNKNDQSIYSKYEGLFFASTWMEGSPLVVADALANGLPVIAFGTSAVIEQISNTRGGIFMGVEVTALNIERGISFVRENRTDLRANGLSSSEGFLSPNRWIGQIEKSLSRAVYEK